MEISLQEISQTVEGQQGPPPFHHVLETETEDADGTRMDRWGGWRDVALGGGMWLWVEGCGCQDCRGCEMPKYATNAKIRFEVLVAESTLRFQCALLETVGSAELLFPFFGFILIPQLKQVLSMEIAF